MTNRVFALCLSLCLFGISQVKSQSLQLTKIDYPSHLTGNKYIQTSGDTVFLLSVVDSLYFKTPGSDFEVIKLPEAYSYFDYSVNDHGQIALVGRGSDSDFHLITTKAPYDQMDSLAMDNFGTVKYSSKDTIILFRGFCSDVAGYSWTEVSTDAGQSLQGTGFSACLGGFNKFRRLDNLMVSYGRPGSAGSPGNVDRFLYHSYNLSNFIGQAKVYDFNDDFSNLFSTLVNDAGQIFLANGNYSDTIPYHELQAAPYYNGELENIGLAPGGMIEAGPLGEGMFIINSNLENSKIFYQKNPGEEFVEVTLNIAEVGRLDRLYQDDYGRLYFVGFDAMYTANGLFFHDQSMLGKLYIDTDVNCTYDNDEILINNVLLEATLSNGEIAQQFVNDGDFQINAPTGSVDIDLKNVDFDIWEYCENPSYSIDNAGSNTEQNIGLTAIQSCSNLDLQIEFNAQRRCVNTFFYISLRNTGSIPVEDATVEVNIGSLLEFVNIEGDYQDLGNGDYLIDFGQIGVYDDKSITMILDIPCDAELEEEFCVSGKIIDNQSCYDEIAEKTACGTVVGSFDPNDIRTFNDQGDLEQYFDKDEYIYYQIRFQNTGNAEAFHVRLEHALPPELNQGSFEFLSSSHDHRIKFEENQLIVRFDNINLPDSTSNPAASQGYFSYRAKPIESIEYGDEINSFVEIFFDFNEPIRTNESSAIIFMESSTEDLLQNDYEIYPNPTADEITISRSINSSPATFQISDIHGRILDVGQISDVTKTVNVHSYQSGIYFILIKQKDGRQVSLKFDKI